MPKIVLSRPDLVAAAGLCVSADPSRPHFHGVLFAPADPLPGLHVVATDGYRLSVGYDRRGRPPGRPLALTLPSRSLWAKFGVRRVSSAEIDPATGSISLSDDTLMLASRTGRAFPDWRRLAPTAPPTTTAPLHNPRHLADFCRIARLLGSRDSPSLSIAGADDSGPQVVRVPGRDDWFGVLMPLRGDRTDLPEWAQYPA